MSEAKTHRMRLDPAPFAKIERGEKTVELRLFDEKRAAIEPGDVIEFTRNGDGAILAARVTGICRFASFEELFRVISPAICGYDEDGDPAVCAAAMNAYYAPEKQREYGAVGLCLEVIEKSEKNPEKA